MVANYGNPSLSGMLVLQELYNMLDINPPRTKESLFCQEAIGTLDELLGFGPNIFALRRFVLFRNMELFRFIYLRSNWISPINYVLAGIVLWFAWNAYFLRGIWLQKRYGLKLGITPRKYLLGFFANVLVLPIAIMTLFIIYLILALFIIYLINYLLAQFARKSSIKRVSHKLHLLVELFGLYDKGPDYSIAPSWSDYFSYLSFLLKLFYCANFESGFIRVSQEIAYIFALGNKIEQSSRIIELNSKLLSRHRKNRRNQKLLYRIQLEKASHFVETGNFSDAQRLLNDIRKPKHSSSEMKYLEIYRGIIRARLAAYTGKFEQAIEVYESMRFETTSALNKTSGSERRLYLTLLVHIMENLTSIRSWLGQYSEALSELEEQLPRLTLKGKFEDTPFRILILYIKTLIDPNTITESDLESVYEDSVKQLNNIKLFYPQIDHTNNSANNNCGRTIHLNTMQTDKNEKADSYSHRDKNHGHDTLSVSLTRKFQLLLGYKPDLDSIRENFLHLAIISSSVNYDDIALKCIPLADVIASFDGLVVPRMLAQFLEVTVNIRSNKLDTAQEILDQIENRYSTNTFVILYSGILKATIVLTKDHDYEKAKWYLDKVCPYLSQIELEASLLEFKEVSQLLHNDNLTKAFAGYSQSVEYLTLFAPIGFLVNLGLGLAHLAYGIREAASEVFAKGLDWLETKRIILETSFDIMQYKKRYSWIYDIAVENLYEAGCFEDALLVADRLRCIGLQVIHHFQALDISEVKDRHLVTHYERIRKSMERLRRLYDEIHVLEHNPDLWSVIARNVKGIPPAERILDELDNLENELDRTLVRIRKKHPKYQMLRQRIAAQNFLDDIALNDTAFLYYHFCGNRLFIFLVSSEGVTAYEGRPSQTIFFRPEDFKNYLKLIIEKYRQILSDVSSEMTNIKECCKELYDICVGPVIQQLFNFKRICVIPDGPLFNLPLHGLMEPQKAQFLIDFFEFVYLPNLQLTPQKHVEQKSLPLKTLVIADPDTYGELPSLASAQREAMTISRLQNATVLSHKEATKTKFIKIAPAFSSIHIAAHSVFDEEFPYASYLRFAGWKDGDCKLRVYEIIALKLNCTVCNLSSCKSGLYSISNEGEVFSIASSFLVAGAKNVVASFWNLDDEAASDFMTSFYDTMKRTTAPQALRDSQLKFSQSQRYSHPKFWVPFYIIGT